MTPKMKLGFSALALCSSVVCTPAVQAQTAWLWADWKEDLSATRWETGGTVAGVTALGLYSWDWGSSKKFRWNPEGWFGEDTGSGGADKLGHGFSAYAINNFLTERLISKGRTPERAALNAALTTQAIMLYVELFDGYSNDHGFAREDLVMNMLGSGLSYVRMVNPRVRDLIDFRLEYQSSGYKGFRPLSDYSGQKYLMAFKLSGVPALRETPLRYLELQTGYYTRGFLKAERDAGLDRSRHTFWGVGINLNELLFGQKTEQDSQIRNAARLFFEHVNVPHTAARTDSRY